MSSEAPISVTPRPGAVRPATEHDACGVGFVVHMKGQRSHDIVRKALQVLINLEHRGACGCEANTGDGAGILIQMPDAFLRKVLPFDAARRRGLRRRARLPAARRARPRGDQGADCPDRRRGGQTLLGWRAVPTDNRLVGESARATQPVFEQLFIGAADGVAGTDGSRPARAQAVRHPEADRARRGPR
jgi:glutamate synthase domain-containing protein 1